MITFGFRLHLNTSRSNKGALRVTSSILNFIIIIIIIKLLLLLLPLLLLLIIIRIHDGPFWDYLHSTL